CVAGGIRSVADAEAILEAGADKISINSPALENPDLIDELAGRFGSQCVVVGVDSQRAPGAPPEAADVHAFMVYQYTGGARRERLSLGSDPHRGSQTAVEGRRCRRSGDLRGQTVTRAAKATDLDGLDFAKGGGLLPAIVQHADTGAVLMLGYMNREALQATLARRRVVFFSRGRQQLWEKGETSGHSLDLEGVAPDCDGDRLLVTA